MPTAELELLRRTRALLAKPEAWTQKWYARTENDKPAFYDDSDAVCWCLSGALAKCAKGNQALIDSAIDILRNLLNGESPIAWQDSPWRTHADVLALLDAAIAEGEREVGK